MKNFIFALIVSITIHFILLINFKDISIKESNQKESRNTTAKYTHINLANIKQPKEIKKVKKKLKKAKPVKKVIKKKKKVIKQIVKKQILKAKQKSKPKPKYKKVYKKNIKPAIRQKNKKIKSVFTTKRKEIKKPIKQITKIIEKKVVKKTIKKIIKKDLILDLAKEYQELQQLDSLTKSYLKLYGNEYFQLSNEQRKYLKDNLNTIGQITQEYLMYPSIAIRTKQSGTNVVEFILKPNGDITDLKITDGSSYSTLDRNTIKTIKIAYKDYPKPTEDTKVKIFVRYILY